LVGLVDKCVGRSLAMIARSVDRKTAVDKFFFCK